MKTLLISLALFVSVSALAASKAYNLDVEYSLNGGKKMTSNVTVEEGKTATVTQEGTNGEKTSIEVGEGKK